MQINGVEVTIKNVPHVSKEEVLGYIAMLTNEHGGVKPKELVIDLDENGDVVLDYLVEMPPFERIRRITGYLVGGMNRWNNAKRAEEHDRVKHGV